MSSFRADMNLLALILVPFAGASVLVFAALAWIAGRHVKRPAARAVVVAVTLLAVVVATVLLATSVGGVDSQSLRNIGWPVPLILYGLPLLATAYYAWRSQDVELWRVLVFAAASVLLSAVLFALISQLVGAETD